jgi:hypothetical protein
MCAYLYTYLYLLFLYTENSGLKNLGRLCCTVLSWQLIIFLSGRNGGGGEVDIGKGGEGNKMIHRERRGEPSRPIAKSKCSDH